MNACFYRPLVTVLTIIGSVVGASLFQANAYPQTFHFNEPIDLGSNLTRIGDLQWSHILGIDWDRDFSIGGIIGKQNATVIPEIREPFFNNVIIPEVKADTRTGARLSGNVSGSTGLEFYADFNAGGLDPGASFQFQPEIVDLPAQVSSGEFFKLQTKPGVVGNPSFDESVIDLPSFEAGMNFFFNLGLNTQVDFGLFPLVPYNSVPFAPTPIQVNQSLLKFGFDLNPDSNEGQSTPPNFVIFEGTDFEQRLGLLDNEESLFEKQISVDMSVEGETLKRRLDIGSVQLVNPFGTGDSFLGPNERNLTVSTATNDSKIEYSYETALLRMGLDLDGIAAYLGSAALTGAGHSFTRIEEKFLDGKISLAVDLIDIKYGPEIGFRESVEIKPDFEVTLSFDRDVAIDNGGQIAITDTYTGKWSDLPGIALLGTESVEVSVSFDQLTGEQTKRSVFYLTDYLELTLWELESLAIEGGPKFSLPPLYQGRTSLLGSLLGEVELEVTAQTVPISPFAFNSSLSGGSTFTLTPTPTTLVYLATNDPVFSTDVSAWRNLSDHATPSSLADATLVIAWGDSSAQLVTDLTPVFPPRDFVVDGSGGTAHVQGLVIPEGAIFRQSFANPGRTWNLSRIVNDGVYYTLYPSPLTINSLVLTIEGQGRMWARGPLELNAQVFMHGSEHHIDLWSPTTPTEHHLTMQQFNNAGRITVSTLASADIVASQRFDNTGIFVVDGGADAEVTTPVLLNDGQISVWHESSSLLISHPDTFGQINIQSTSGTGRFHADLGGTLRFTHTVLLNTPGNNPQPVRFEAENGSTVHFDRDIRAFDAGVAELYVDETSTMVLNGVEVKRDDANVSLVNKGLVEVMSGGNLFYFNPDFPFEPGEEPRIIGINVDNQGTVRIHPGATLGFRAEIVDYVPGGATLGSGTWELVGAIPANPYLNDEQSFALGTARLDIDIAFIVNEDTYLGRIDFGDTTGDGFNDGYSAEDYDTQLAVSEANVLLSGAARFDYFNTIRENRGTFTLRNNNHFTTAGDLLNSGAIHLEADARLNVFGDLVVDGGTVVVDSTSVLDVGGNSIEVIGGNVTIQRGSGPVGVDSKWVIREKWLGVDELGEDIVQESRVSYGDAWFTTIGPNAEILLEGEQAVFEPLSGMNFNQGKVTLTGGNELHLGHSITNAGTLILSNAGKLYVDGNMLTYGQLDIDAESFLSVSGAFHATNGVLQLDGVVQASSFEIDGSLVLTGSGRFAGLMENRATLSPGNSAGTFEVLGDYTQAANGRLDIEILGTLSGVDYDQLLVSESATLNGFLDVSLTGGYALEPGQEITVLTASLLTDNGISLAGTAASYFDLIINPGVNGSVVLEFLGGDFPNPADFNGDGVVDGADLHVWETAFGVNSMADANGDEISDGADFLAWQRQFERGTAVPATSEAVPEPGSISLLLITAVLWFCRGRGSKVMVAGRF